MNYRSPLGLCLINEDGKLYLYDPGTEHRWPSSIFTHPLLPRLLEFCQKERAESELLNFIYKNSQCDRETALATVTELTSSRLLLSGTSIPSSNTELWVDKNWMEALAFHHHTNNLKKMNYSDDPKGLADKALMSEYLRAENQPSSYKELAGKLIALPLVSDAEDVGFQTALSNEIFKELSTPLNLERLSWFLKLAYGEISARIMPVTGQHVGKTSPSGGSRHPTEVYPIILDVPTIDNGLYHYNVKGHALTLIKDNDYREFIFRHLFRHRSRINFQPRVAFVFTTIFERSMFRYRESRSYRVMHYDLGHILQTTSYLSRSLNMHCYRSYTLDEQAVEREIGIDGIQEAAMAVAVIG